MNMSSTARTEHEALLMHQSREVPEQVIDLYDGLLNLHNALLPLCYQVLVVLNVHLQKQLLPAVSTEAVYTHRTYTTSCKPCHAYL